MAKKEKTGKRDYHYSMNHSTFGDDLYMCDIDSYSVEYISDDGDKEWYLNDKLHREDGPAIEHADGAKEWYVDGEQIEVPNNDNDIFLRMINLKVLW